MMHPDEGRLRALLDEETSAPESAEIRAHLATCAACAETLRAVEGAQRATTSLLAAIDAPAPVERVRARLAAHRAPPVRRSTPARRRWLGADLAKAAALLLGFAGMVTAAVHPASPLHRWMTGEPATRATAPTLAPEAAATAAAREVGVRVPLVPAGVTVALTGAAAGTTIEVSWVDEGSAAVYAGEGTTFSTTAAEGRIDATLAAGPVRVELPRGASRASLVVDGRVYLEKAGERIDYPGPPALVEGTRARFEVR